VPVPVVLFGLAHLHKATAESTGAATCIVLNEIVFASAPVCSCNPILIFQCDPVSKAICARIVDVYRKVDFILQPPGSHFNNLVNMLTIQPSVDLETSTLGRFAQQVFNPVCDNFRVTF
jgi:hypothetical protein